MKRIVLDFLGRWRWVYVGAAASSLAVAALIDRDRSSLLMGFIPLFYAGTFLLFFGGVNRGMMGVIRTLPLARWERNVAMWLLGVGIPVLIFAAVLIGGVSLRGGDLSLGVFSFTILCALGLSGMQYFAMTGLAIGGASSGWTSQLPGMFYGALWGIGFAAPGMLSFWLPMEWGAMQGGHLAVLIAALAMTGCALFRSDSVGRLQKTTNGGRGELGERVLELRLQQGFQFRWILLVWPIWKGLLILGAIFFVFIAAASMYPNGALSRLARWIQGGVVNERGIGFLPAGQVGAIFGMMSSLGLLSSLRRLKTLPVSTTRLAVILALVPFSTVLVAWLIVYLIAVFSSVMTGGGGLAITPAFVSLGCLAATWISLVCGFVLRTAGRSGMGMLVVGMVGVFALFGPIMVIPGVRGFLVSPHWAMLVAMAAGLWAFWNARQGLNRSEIFHPDAFRIGPWAARGGNR